MADTKLPELPAPKVATTAFNANSEAERLGYLRGLEEAEAEAMAHDETGTSGYDTAHQIAAAIRQLKDQP